MWFEELTGFVEQTGPAGREAVQQQISVENGAMTMHALDRVRTCGHLRTPKLSALRKRVETAGLANGHGNLREVVADVQDLHCDPGNAGALFQVASQFNLLEMVSPDVSPEAGISGYAHDRTQGPACAIACGAGTIYRNYFAAVGDQLGQSADHQIDCLADLGAEIGNENDQLWQMRNGYVQTTRAGLDQVTETIASLTPHARTQLLGQLRIGMQSNTEVTLPANDEGQNHVVTQAYCSALPVAYSGLPDQAWELFACLVLDAAYEATILAGALNAAATGNNTVYLTLLGGGAFGNDSGWIIEAMERALRMPAAQTLDVAVVSYGSPSATYAELAGRLAD